MGDLKITDTNQLKAHQAEMYQLLLKHPAGFKICGTCQGGGLEAVPAQPAGRYQLLSKVKHVTIETAKQLAKETDSRAIIIIRWGKDGTVGGASYGQDKKICTAAGKWLDDIVDEMLDCDGLLD